MSGGRPSKYSDEILQQARDYVDNFAPTNDEAVPSIAGLAYLLHVSRETIYDWAKQEDKAEFSDIVDRLMTRQELMLASGGLKGTHNATIAKLMLTKHGYTDKVDTSLKMNPEDLKNRTTEELIYFQTHGKFPD